MCIRDRYYLKVKIFELLLYLDALELAGTKEERPYFYKTQVEKIKSIRSLMTENLTEHYTFCLLYTSSCGIHRLNQRR